MGSGRVEVRVAYGAGNFQQNIFSVATPVTVASGSHFISRQTSAATKSLFNSTK
jgi:hypothetical protein